MWIALTLTLLFASPEDAGAGPFSKLSSAAQVMFQDYLEVRAKTGRVFEVVGAASKRGESRAVLLDRTDCVRGWVVLSSMAGVGAEAPSFAADEYVGAKCEAPTGLAYLARIHDALARRDAVEVAKYFKAGAKLPVATERPGAVRRRTLSGEDVLAGLSGKAKVGRLPTCDLLSEVPSCTRADGADASGSVAIECRCDSARRLVSYSLRVLEPALGAASPVQVTAVKERLGKR